MISRRAFLIGAGSFLTPGILLTVGECAFEAPDPPLWKDYLRMEGYKPDRLSDIRAVLEERSLYPACAELQGIPKQV